MLSVILASVLKTQILQDKVGNMRAEQVCVRDNKCGGDGAYLKGQPLLSSSSLMPESIRA